MRVVLATCICAARRQETQRRVYTCAHVDWSPLSSPHLSLFKGAAFFSLWEHYGFVPERFDLIKDQIQEHPGAAEYPLRPELAER